MWVEGVTEFEGHLRSIFGHAPSHGCSLTIGGHAFPLRVTSYVGPGYIYLNVPATYLLFRGWVADPYVYRFTGILLFVACGWILHAALRTWSRNPAALGGALLFLTSPLLFLMSLTDYQLFFLNFALLFTGGLLFLRWRAGSSNALFHAAAFTFGALSLARVEMVLQVALVLLVWWLVAGRRPAVAAPHRSPSLRLAALFAILGALPFLVTQVGCRPNLVDFLRERMLPVARGEAGLSLGQRFVIRSEQLLDFNLLQRWPRFELLVPDFPFALAFASATVFLVWRWIRNGDTPFAIIAILVIFPTTLVAFPRPEHMTMLQSIILLLPVTALDRIAAARPRVAAAIVILLVGANVGVLAADLRHWGALPPTSHTMLNQSDPRLLASYLEGHSGDAAIVFTNIGIDHYVRYATRGRITGRNIMDWNGVDDFESRVLETLEADGRTMFVSIARERDGRDPFVAHTALLYEILDREGVRYQVERLESRRGVVVYEIARVEGAGR